MHQARLHADQHAVDLDLDAVHIDPLPEPGRLPIHGHSPGLDHVLGHPPAEEPDPRQNLLETIAFVLGAGHG